MLCKIGGNDGGLAADCGSGGMREQGRVGDEDAQAVSVADADADASVMNLSSAAVRRSKRILFM
jgi:hypothetical protein